MKKYKNHLIIGDFNIDLLKVDNNSQEHLNNLLEKGFYPGFQTITRPSTDDHNKGSCIDNIFIKTSSIKTKTFKLSTLFNDHYPLFISLQKINKTSVNNKTFIPVDYTKLSRLADNVNWSSILLINDPNIATNELISGLKNCIELSRYSKNKSKNHYKSAPRSNWITTGIINSCKTKELLYQICKNEPNNELIKMEYKNYVKVLDKIINEAKLMYDREQIIKNSNDTKKLWKYVNQKLAKNNRKDGNIIYLYDENKLKIKDSDKIANTMNSYFCNIGTKLSNEIQKPQNKEIKLPSMNKNSIFITPTDSFEIASIIHNLKLKNGGVDNIDAKTLIVLSRHIVLPLVHIINLSIEKAIWPDALKSADVTPIYKAKERHNVTNYRPISLISNLAKIFEKVLYQRLLGFIKKNKILSKMQYGFMKKIGTKDALNFITNIIYEKLDKSTPIAVTFLDLAKAFDTVNHVILLDKLYRYGIRGNAFQLISNYLTGRYQRVKINGTVSSFSEIQTGVPQGTILGPLLFILYINDLLIELPEGIILSFADDTAVISTGKTWNVVETQMNNYLNEINNWLALNKLSLNVDKTVFMTFGNYCDSVPDNIEIKINNKKLNRVETCKYLGVYFDYRMRWESHIEYLINKTKYLVFIFRKMAKIMLRDSLMMLYYVFFHSIICYGNIAWGGAYSTNLLLLQRLQNKLLKIIYKNHFVVDKKPLNLNQIFAFESLKYYYNMFKDKFINSNSITRNKSIVVPRRCKTIISKSSYIKAINVFNDLPNEYKTIGSLTVVKKKIKPWIMTNIQ